MPAHVVWLMLIVFWTPGKDTPTRIEHATFTSQDVCDNMAQALDREWMSRVKGGSTSWLCTGAFPAPTT